MKIYYVCSTICLWRFFERTEAENSFNSFRDHGYEPLFLIVADETTGDYKVDQWILD